MRKSDAQRGRFRFFGRHFGQSVRLWSRRWSHGRGQPMRYACAAIFILFVASCGADGEPEPMSTGVSITGEARIGVKGSL